MEKLPKLTFDQDPLKESLGEAPAVLAKRKPVDPAPWCPTSEEQKDPSCNPDFPKTITYKDILTAYRAISEEIPRTPLVRSKCCAEFDMEIFYKVEIFYQTGSYNERKAFYALSVLNEDEKCHGVITASLGNWALALAFYGQRLGIPVTVVLPSTTPVYVVGKCHELGAFVVSYGETLDDARRQAFVMLKKRGQVYINGYDNPNVIAASASIGIEILEQLPETDAIIVPVGGGGLLAGISAAVKHIKPGILVYGVQTKTSSSFYNAMEKGRPYQTVVTRNLATSLIVPTAGYNAFHTARGLIDKMVLVNDDCISRAMLHLVEEEKLIVEGAGAASLATFMSMPNILPELRKKTVVCVLTGGNIDTLILPRCLERAKIIEGRIVKLSVRLSLDEPWEHLKVLSMIANVGANVIQYLSEKPLLDDDFDKTYLKVLCETRDIGHACTLKRVMERLFPNKCQFYEEPYRPVPICACFPRR
ncbi:L-threonine ammonia-lyase-like isoform X2 [Pieris brassicae]|uniref:L-threonine ammonia-lyase-like isoform X2 n=1 Tax=Pieris brassicae TaxID=7116 RepID=UPI001E662678|nr:L-threonine ammonia-lyase-like isoform X2 [Pieris brassicae]